MAEIQVVAVRVLQREHLENRMVHCMPEAEEAVRAFIRQKNDGGISFGNARGVRNVFEKILVQQANRLAGLETVTKEMLTQITEADVRAAAEAG